MRDVLFAEEDLWLFVRIIVLKPRTLKLFSFMLYVPCFENLVSAVGLQPGEDGLVS